MSSSYYLCVPDDHVMLLIPAPGGYSSFALDQQQVDKALEDGYMYRCGGEHGDDLHLTPDREWSVEDVEKLLQLLDVPQAIRNK